MAWYYMDGEQEVGPVEKNQLQALIKSKQINGQTLVRSDTSTEWRTLLEATKSKPQTAVATPPAPPASPQTEAPAAAAQTAAAPAVASAVCSQCGRTFPNDQVVTFDDQVICAACKPMFVQRLREGVRTTSDFTYAGFWIRVGAKIIDTVILLIVQYAIIIPTSILAMSLAMENPDDPAGASTIALMVIPQLVAFVIPIVYTTFFLGRFGATLGKLACKLRVVTPDGEKISYWRAFGRNFSEMVNGFTLGVGYLMVAWDDQKRGLHDRISSTRVVYK